MPLRSMHSLDAIGKGVEIKFDDAAKTIHMGFEVVDPLAIKKFKKGIFCGFSQGGPICEACRLAIDEDQRPCFQGMRSLRV